MIWLAEIEASPYLGINTNINTSPLIPPPHQMFKHAETTDFRERVHQHMALLKGRQLNKRLCVKGGVQITPPILQTNIINCLRILDSLLQSK